MGHVLSAIIKKLGMVRNLPVMITAVTVMMAKRRRDRARQAAGD